MDQAIDTSRLLLRRFLPIDLEPFHDYRTRGYGRFACVWKATGEVIGFSGIKFLSGIGENELGYRFLTEYWGMGLATEAGRASIDFARQDLGLTRLVAQVHPDNAASARVVTKLGFSLERKIGVPALNDIELNLFARSL